MTNEIELYYDTNFKKKVEGKIEFSPVVAEEETKKELYIFNNLDYKVNLILELEGEMVELVEKELSIEPKTIKPIHFILNPKKTSLKPITANIKIKLNYIVV